MRGFIGQVKNQLQTSMYSPASINTFLRLHGECSRHDGTSQSFFIQDQMNLDSDYIEIALVDSLGL